MTKNKELTSYQRIYWVFTQLCNDHCDHCYNNSGSKGERISEADCLAIVGNLPDELEQIILSGGEPLADKKLLYVILDALNEKYERNINIILQFNGDLLTPKILTTLIEKNVRHYSIASIDRYHKKQGERKELLAQMFDEQGIGFNSGQPKLKRSDVVELQQNLLSYGFFGASEDMWLGGNWARGRAMKHDIWKKDGAHNFCAIPSGAKGFLGLPTEENYIQELSIQLWKINPCCPGTVQAMGDARTEKVLDVVNRMSKHEVMRKLNTGDAYAIGEAYGISAKEGLQRAVELGNVCLWCDEFFTKHYDMKEQRPIKNGELAKSQEF